MILGTPFKEGDPRTIECARKGGRANKGRKFWRPKLKWRSVEDELPPEDRAVLAYSPKWGQWVSVREGRAWMAPDLSISSSYVVPTHWMDCPNPPKMTYGGPGRIGAKT